MAFNLPPDGDLFIDQVFTRCTDLIRSGIWDGLEQVRLDTWIKNFTDGIERYFAACILDALIYRSEKQTVALMEQLFQRILPDLLRRTRPTDHNSWLDYLKYPPWGSAPPIRMVPVIKADDPPAKSGPALCRLYRRNLGIDQSWMIWPWEIRRAKKNGVKMFIFVDDFLGTGDQFTEFVKAFRLKSTFTGCFSVYAPLVAHRAGLRELKAILPRLHVVAVETIDDSYSVFSKDAKCFNDKVNSPALAKEFYDNLVRRVNFQIRPEALRGYGKLSLAYAFNHATPDNCLPILWSHAPEWKPLLDR